MTQKLAEEPLKTPTRMNPSKNVPVQILDDRGCVDTKQAQVSRGDSVTWFSHGNEKATIAFNGDSPFLDESFAVPASGSATRAVRDDAQLGSYKYTVVAPEGSNDPEVIIN